MDCKCLADFFTAGVAFSGVIIALITIVHAFKKYKQAKRFQKATFFMELRRRFKENSDFTKIREMIEKKEDLKSLSKTQLYNYAGFFEELQIAINSGFISEEMCYYLYGYYIIQFYNTNAISSEAPLWAAFKELVENMKRVQKDFHYSIDLKY